MPGQISCNKVVMGEERGRCVSPLVGAVSLQAAEHQHQSGEDGQVVRREELPAEAPR